VRRLERLCIRDAEPQHEGQGRLDHTLDTHADGVIELAPAGQVRLGRAI
jgi:hypothetical protein